MHLLYLAVVFSMLHDINGFTRRFSRFDHIGIHPIHPSLLEVVTSLSGPEASNIRVKLLSLYTYPAGSAEDYTSCKRQLAHVMANDLNCPNAVRQLLQPTIAHLEILWHFFNNPAFMEGIITRNCSALDGTYLQICNEHNRDNYLNRLPELNVTQLIPSCYFESLRLSNYRLPFR